MNKIIAAYIKCIESLVLQSQIPTVEVIEEKPESDSTEVDETFQYEALIEQLRFEKQDFADKYKTAQILLNEIYLKYKDTLDLDKVDSLEKMKLTEIAVVFKVDLGV